MYKKNKGCLYNTLELLDKYSLNTMVMLLAAALKDEIHRGDTLVEYASHLDTELHVLNNKFENLDRIVTTMLFGNKDD